MMNLTTTIKKLDTGFIATEQNKSHAKENINSIVQEYERIISTHLRDMKAGEEITITLTINK